MGVWSTHAWGTDIYGPYPQAGSSTEVLCKYLFTDSANNADPAMPKFVTEYATHEMTYNCVTYPHGDNYGGWNDELEFPYFCVTNCMPYAARVYENTLGLLNGGAEVPFIWQLNDEWSEVFDKGKGWGLIDLWGNEKPVYGALKTLYPKIPVGSQVVVPSDQSTNNLYTGAFVDDDQIIVGISNDNDSEYSTTIYLHNAPENLKITEAVAFEQSYWGNPETGEPDEGQQVEKDLDLLDDHDPGKYSFYVTLPANSTLTVVLEPISLGLEGAIVAWGKNDCGSEPVPQGDDFVDVACGYYHNLALRTDGTIAAWGSNYHGQCNIPELGYEEETYIDIACGKYHSLALTSQGRLVAWGRNKYGACETPKGNDFVAIACGDYHNLAIRNDGSLVTWGWDFYGQCDVPEGYDYVDISAGWAHSLAIKEDGSLVQWGKNNGSSYDSPGGIIT